MRIHPFSRVSHLPVTVRAPRRRISANCALRTCVVLALCPALASADDWINPSTGDWFLGSNWADGTVPTAVDDANVDNGGFAQLQSPNAFANLLKVGSMGTGMLTITSDGSLKDQLGLIGDSAGANGDVSVDGPGANWSNFAGVIVGRSGNGILNVRNGGTLITADGFDPTVSVFANGDSMVGYDTMSTGTVEIDGAGSAWINNKNLYVGWLGSGSLSISDGATVNNHLGVIGSALVDSGSSGSVVVDGVGSTWINRSSLTVGDGAGTLIVSNGGRVSAKSGFLGSNGNSSGVVTVDGVGSRFSTTIVLDVGSVGNGTLAVNNGGKIDTEVAFIGDHPLGSGSAVVDGEGSIWVSVREIIVGNNGTGALSVQNLGTVDADGIGVATGANSNGALIVQSGGMMNGNVGDIGGNNGSAGTAIVDGLASHWSQGTLTVGSFGTGSLGIRNGGTVTLGGGSGTLTLGQWGGNGTVNIGTGRGTEAGILQAASVAGGPGVTTLNFNHDSTIYSFTSNGTADGNPVLITGNTNVNHLGFGTTYLFGDNTYSGSTVVAGGVLRLNGSITSTSAANVRRGVLTLENGGVLTIGNGAGTLFLGTAGDGGTLNIGSGGAIGLLNAASVESLSGVFPPGTVNFNHDNPNYVFSTDGTANGVLVGISGTSDVNQIGSGTTTLPGNYTYTGATTVDNGSLRVLGALANTSRLDVGVSGSGQLRLEGGGTINASFGSIGTNTGSFGAVLIDGAGSTWTNQDLLDVGSSGSGTLTILHGGRVIGGLASIGLFSGEGSVLVDGAGSSWSNTTLHVGNLGRGTLLISGGGQVNTDFGWVGSGGNGVVTVDGAGSAWTGMRALNIGAVGVGTLSIHNGGVVRNLSGMIGQSTGSAGSVTVSGAGSTWTNDVSMDIGFSGNGNLLVNNAATVNASNITIGLFGFGAATIDGVDAMLSARNILDIGSNGSGVLNINNGASVRSVEGRVGFFPDGSGVITVDGSGSRWTNSGNIFRLGNGALTLRNGGQLAIADGAGPLQLSAGGALVIDGADAGIVNASSIFGTGAGTLNFTHGDPNYAFTQDAAPNGAPVLIRGGTKVNQLGSGTTILTGTNTYTGATTISAGTLRVNGSITSNTSVNSGGTLGGSGTIAAVNVANGGALAPGSVVGTLTTGALSLANGSRLNFELGAPGAASDLLVVNGGLVLDGVLNVQAMAGFAPGTYRLINYSGSLTDNQLSVGSLPAGFVAAIDTTTPGQVNLAVTSGRPAGNQAPSGEVTITGTPREGLTVHAVDTLADADGLGAFSYQWFVGDAMASGANSATLTLDDLKVGKMLRVVVSYTDGQGFSEQISSAAVGPVAPAGTDLPFQKRLFFVNPADNPNQQTFIRLVNPNDADVAVQIQGYDDNGTPAPGGEVVLMLSAQQSLQLNAADLELGNAGKGLDGALGNGVGKWQLKVNSSAPIEAMSLIRTPDGFLTSVTETVPTEAAGVHVLYFANPGSNPNQQSFIRVVNRSGASGEVNVSAVDDAGIPAPGGDIRFTLAANAALNFNAEDYTNGNPAKSLQGAFGTGTGKWQLTVSSALNLEVMSLIRTPDGFLTDLSNIAPRAASGDDSDRLLLSVVSGNNADQQGLIRLVNRGGLAENVTLSAIDDTGIRAPTSAVVEVAPFAAVQLLASDLEQGNPAKGLTGAFGSGEGRWQINATPQARVEAQSLLRVPGGFLTNLSASAPRESQFEARLWIFNPGSNDQQRSILRLINRSDTSGVALIEAVDDLGQPAPGGSISVDLAPRTAVELDALELEVGNPAKGLIGALGDGNGKWRLRISADVTIEVQGLLETPTGFLTNLSSTVH
jgi:T5SS/PEP-CTERM-associated repeat protein/autotransporter-associated beta strand protein